MNFLYLVASGNDDGIYKIGISVDPIQRLEQIKRDYDVPYAFILETMDVGSRDEVFAVETALHVKYDRFQSNKYSGREWFKLSKAQIAEIKAMYQQESNAFAQATAYYGVVQEMEELRVKANEMESERQVKIRFNRVNGRHYDTRPTGALKRFNELKRRLNEGFLGQRFGLKTFQHPIVDLKDSTLEKVKEVLQEKVKGMWWKLGTTAGVLTIAGTSAVGGSAGDVFAGAAFSSVIGILAGGLNAPSRVDIEKRDVAEILTNALRKETNGEMTAKLTAVLDMQDRKSFLVSDYTESFHKLRNQPALRPRLNPANYPALQQAIISTQNRKVIPWGSLATISFVAGILTIAMSQQVQEMKARTSFFILPEASKSWTGSGQTRVL